MNTNAVTLGFLLSGCVNLSAFGEGGSFHRETSPSPIQKGISTCGVHGGIDCAAGRDNDGSVICSDGFRDSPQRHSFECTAAKLNVEQTSCKDNSLQILVRNMSGVDAEAVRVTVKGIRSVEGPQRIEGSSSEIYSAWTPDCNAVQQKSLVEVNCGNCR